MPDPQPSQEAQDAAQAINNAWRWDIPLDDVALIIDEHFTALRQRLGEVEQDRKAFRDALEALHGEQNGPPLIRHEKTWRAANDRATELLYPEIFAAMKASQPQSPTP